MPKRKLKYYRVDFKEVDYGEQYIEAYTKKDAVEVILEQSCGNIDEIIANEITKNEYEENV